jgi:hypothetical protein
MSFRFVKIARIFGIAGALQALTFGGPVDAGGMTQLDIPATNRMPALPEPLVIRPWAEIARDYYPAVFDPLRKGEGFPATSLDGSDGFRMKSYLGSKYDTEAFTCLSAIVGAKLCGLDPRNLDGIDFLARSGQWFDPEIGLYRHRAGQRGPEVHADIYGYWPAIIGLMLADLYPENSELRDHANRTFTAFQQIAHGLGCPEHPDFSGLGWNFASREPGGRDEPMNRLGNAPSVAWALMAGGCVTGDKEMTASSRAAMRWYISHPGRYEVTHVMGPLTVARLNTTGEEKLDLGGVMNAWFGDGPSDRNPWWVTSGTRVNGITCDGLDAARGGNDGFYAFTMGSLQNPAWLVPVVRYDPRYARAIGRFALNAANSCRLLEGHGLGDERQDHAKWKSRWDKGDMFFYEGLRSQGPASNPVTAPYATGDPVANGWTGHSKVAPENYIQERSDWFGKRADNIALYMGNHVGFLGGIMRTTDVPGILSWDCVKTDWFHPPAFPTRLLFNPYGESKELHLDLGDDKCDLYDLVSRSYLLRNVSGTSSLNLAAGTAAVIVMIPDSAPAPENKEGRFVSGTTVIDWNGPGPVTPS